MPLTFFYLFISWPITLSFFRQHWRHNVAWMSGCPPSSLYPSHSAEFQNVVCTTVYLSHWFLFTPVSVLLTLASQVCQFCLYFSNIVTELIFGRYMQKLQIQICDLCGETDLLKLSGTGPILTLGYAFSVLLLLLVPTWARKSRGHRKFISWENTSFSLLLMVHVHVYPNMMQTYQFGHCNTVVIFIFLSLDFVPRQLQEMETIALVDVGVCL